MVSFVLNLVTLAVGFVLAAWSGIVLHTSLYEAFTRLAWHRRGTLAESSAFRILRQLFFALTISLSPVAILLALLGWLAPAALPWALAHWGAWTGLALGLAWSLLTLFGTSREERQAEFYGDHRERIAPNLNVRQMTYLKPFRLAWEKAEGEKQAKASASGQASEKGEDEDDEDEDKEDDALEAPAHLDFEIVGITPGQSMKDVAPHVEPGGDWTVIACRTLGPTPASFCFAERSGAPSEKLPMAWGEARLWVPTAPDGVRLAEAIADAFGVRRRDAGGTAVVGALAFNTVVFSRHTQAQSDGSLSGAGSWTASKWFHEEATEVFVNWSVEEMTGRFAEKDEAYRADLYAAFRSLVR